MIKLQRNERLRICEFDGNTFLLVHSTDDMFKILKHINVNKDKKINIEINDYTTLKRVEQLFNFTDTDVSYINDELKINGEVIKHAPVVIENVQHEYINILSKFLVEKIKNIGLATKDSNREVLKGIFFAENGDAVATDGHILCGIKTEYKFSNDLIKPEAFKYIKGDCMLEKLIIDGTVVFKISDYNTTIFTKTIQDNFVNYKKAIPDYTLSEEIENLSVFKNYKNFISGKDTFNKVSLVDNKLKNIDGFFVGKLRTNLLDGYTFKSSLLNIVYKVLGDKTQVFVNNENNKEKSVLFGNLHDTFCVVMPCNLSSY